MTYYLCLWNGVSKVFVDQKPFQNRRKADRSENSTRQTVRCWWYSVQDDKRIHLRHFFRNDDGVAQLSGIEQISQEYLITGMRKSSRTGADDFYCSVARLSGPVVLSLLWFLNFDDPEVHKYLGSTLSSRRNLFNVRAVSVPWLERVRFGLSRVVLALHFLFWVFLWLNRPRMLPRLSAVSASSAISL